MISLKRLVWTLSLFLAATAYTEAASDISKIWTLSMSGPNGETLEMPLELKAKGETLEGRLDRGGNQWLKIKDGKINGDKFSFTIERDRPGGGLMVYKMSGTLADNKLKGKAETDFQGQTVDAEWSAVPAPLKASAIAGDWTMHLQDPNGGNIELPMEIKVEDQTISGRVGRGDGRWMKIENGSASVIAPPLPLQKKPMTAPTGSASRLAQGLSNKDVANALDISVRTVETHRKNIKRKLGISSTAGLTRYALEHGVLQGTGNAL